MCRATPKRPPVNGFPLFSGRALKFLRWISETVSRRRPPMAIAVPRKKVGEREFRSRGVGERMPRFVRREEAAEGRRGARGAMDQKIELRELKRVLKMPTGMASVGVGFVLAVLVMRGMASSDG